MLNTPIIKTHLLTSNVYVQREIVLTNLILLEGFISSDSFKSSNIFLKRPWYISLAKQKNILNDLNQKIISNEQLTFIFGG